MKSKFSANQEDLFDLIRPLMNRRLHLVVQTFAKQDIPRTLSPGYTPRTGKMYQGQRAAGEGEPPVTRSGDLADWEVVIHGEYNDEDWQGEAESTVSYAVWQEYGTSKMDEHPFIVRTLWENKDKYMRIMAGEY